MIKRKPHSQATRNKLSKAAKRAWKNLTIRKKQCAAMRKPHPNSIGEKHHLWKGGRLKRPNGYIEIYKPKHPFSNSLGYVKEHRLVIEKIIKRYLTPKEVVHHRGKRDDNRPHMLMVFASNGLHRSFEYGKHVPADKIIFDGRNYHC